MNTKNINITLNEVFGLVQVLGSVESNSFDFNLAVYRNVLLLQVQIKETQEAIKGLSEDQVAEVGMKKVSLEFGTVSKDIVPKKLSMQQTVAVAEYMMEEPIEALKDKYNIDIDINK